MPSYVVRASREPDSPYLIWSTVVDAPTYVFANRDEALLHLVQESGLSTARTRLARADKNGSSAIEPAGAFGWDDDEFIVMNGVPDQPKGVWWGLPRDRLAEFAAAYLNDDEAAAMALLVARPFEDATPPSDTPGEPA